MSATTRTDAGENEIETAPRSTSASNANALANRHLASSLIALISPAVTKLVRTSTIGGGLGGGWGYRLGGAGVGAGLSETLGGKASREGAELEGGLNAVG